MKQTLSEVLLKYYYNEEKTERKIQNIHQEHLPDEMLNFGKSGIERAINIITNIINKQTDKININLKWDGSPAIVFGVLPFDFGKYKQGTFFIGTKGVFAKSPKIATTIDEIKKLYKDEVAQKLINVFDSLKASKPTTILQGDLMWSCHNDKLKTIINGEEVIIFKPNTITYGVIKNKNETLYNIIDKAKVGIVVHTKYTGNNFENMQPSYNPQINKDYYNTKDVWFGNANITKGMIETLDDETITKVKTIIDKIKNIKINDHLFDILKLYDLNALLKIFINYLIVKENIIVGNENQFINKFIKWYKERIEKKKEQLKTDKAKIKLDQSFNNIVNIIDKYKSDFINLLKVYKLINNAVDLIVNALNTFINTEVDVWLNEGDKFNKTNHEGFVVVTKQDQSINKLVNRLIFSRANFLSKLT